MSSFSSSFLAILASFVLLSMITTTTPAIAQDTNSTRMFLDAHNNARTAVGVPPLVWNETLANYARTFADNVKKTCDNTLESGGPYGENTASGYAAFTDDEAVNWWVEEKSNYDHGSNKCINGRECQHYTQVVWKDSAQLGCASIVCGAGWPFAVCEYYPPGNVQGQKPY